MRPLRFLVVLVLSSAIGLTAAYAARLWVPQMRPPAIPLMLAVLGGIRLGSYIARDKRSNDVDDAIAWALGFVCAGIWCWRSPVAAVLPLVAAVYTLSSLGMHKRHYPHHWPPQDPMERHTQALEERPWKPLLGNVRPAYRNPDGTNR